MATFRTADTPVRRAKIINIEKIKLIRKDMYKGLKESILLSRNECRRIIHVILDLIVTLFLIRLACPMCLG